MTKFCYAANFLLLASNAVGGVTIRGGPPSSEHPENNLDNLPFDHSDDPKKARVLLGNKGPGLFDNNKDKGAAIRAFDVSSIAGSDIASILSGEESVPVDDGSKAGVIFRTMAELAQAGHTYADMEREMALKGFDKTTIQDILSTDAENKEKVINLMRGLAQKELVQTLSMKDEDTVKGNAKRVDIFGNDVKGPDRLRPPSSSGRLPPKNDSKPSSAAGNHGDHPFGGSHEGWGTVLVKPAPKDDDGRHLVEVPDGCSVPYPAWVGDGWCDKSGGYNTEECNWDGGDCCDFTCASGQSYNCGIVGYDHDCGIVGYDCKSCSVEFEDWVGDGHCDKYGGYNTAGCGYDGGDCCEQTCKDATHSCGAAGIYGYDCECGPTHIVQAPFPHPGREGPGFRIRNDTPWPVEMSLWQVGPLYWGMVQPGEYFYRETDAVHFTVKATINMDNEPQIGNWDAVWPIAAIIAGLALAIVTNGSSAALSATVATGGAAGIVSGTVVAAIASTLLGMGMKAGTALYVTTCANAATQAVMTSEGVTLAVKEALFQDLYLSIQSSWMSVSDADTYAGSASPWPLERETQTARVHGGLRMESAHLGNQCVNVFRQDTSSNLKLSCESGACFLGSPLVK